MRSRLTGSSPTAAAFAVVFADMERIAATTPLGPWREPMMQSYQTPLQIEAKIHQLIDRLNAHNARFSQNGTGNRNAD